MQDLIMLTTLGVVLLFLAYVFFDGWVEKAVAILAIIVIAISATSVAVIAVEKEMRLPCQPTQTTGK